MNAGYSVAAWLVALEKALPQILDAWAPPKVVVDVEHGVADVFWIREPVISKPVEV